MVQWGLSPSLADSEVVDILWFTSLSLSLSLSQATPEDRDLCLAIVETSVSTRRVKFTQCQGGGRSRQYGKRRHDVRAWYALCYFSQQERGGHLGLLLLGMVPYLMNR